MKMTSQPVRRFIVSTVDSVRFGTIVVYLHIYEHWSPIMYILVY